MALDEVLKTLAAAGVDRALFGQQGELQSVSFHPPAPPPVVVTPGEDEADLPPGPVDAAAIALAGRRRAERKSEAE
jgi:hypothetical protein